MDKRALIEMFKAEVHGCYNSRYVACSLAGSHLVLSGIGNMVIGQMVCAGGEGFFLDLYSTICTWKMYIMLNTVSWMFFSSPTVRVI